MPRSLLPARGPEEGDELAEWHAGDGDERGVARADVKEHPVEAVGDERAALAALAALVPPADLDDRTRGAIGIGANHAGKGGLRIIVVVSRGNGILARSSSRGLAPLARDPKCAPARRDPRSRIFVGAVDAPVVRSAADRSRRVIVAANPDRIPIARALPTRHVDGAAVSWK